MPGRDSGLERQGGFRGMACVVRPPGLLCCHSDSALVSGKQAGSTALLSIFPPHHHQPAFGPDAAGWKGGAGALHTTGPKIVRDAYLTLFNTTLGE